MIKNNKGAILVVTIVSMMILTIIGYITLQMVSNQNVMDTYDQTKIRVDYAAEGIVERARGYIDYITLEKSTVTASAMGDIGVGRGYLSHEVESSLDQKWFLLENAEDGNQIKGAEVYDNSIYPNIFAGDIYCEPVLVETDGIVPINTDDLTNRVFRRSYRIVVNAYATVNAAGGSNIVSTVACYFYAEHRITDVDNGGVTIEQHVTTYHILGWRKS